MQETQRREEAECTVVSKPSVSVSKAASRAAEQREQRDGRARAAWSRSPSTETEQGEEKVIDEKREREVSKPTWRRKREVVTRVKERRGRQYHEEKHAHKEKGTAVDWAGRRLNP